MGYLAIARQWRPSRFEDLVGQAHVVQTLKNAILLDRVSHAYLFSGARGVGKTSVARIFAKALRCPNAKDAIPCNECPECQAISESRSVDVVEIDGASNNGVEAVRGIRENVAYGPSCGNYKIYIIDEVHMLSLSAFNALLKTLEEPPAHVIFVFATTEVQKIPLTILSRCQRFEFRRLTQTEIVERLKRILAEEKVSISEEGLRTLASHSDGALRDALSLLDQVLSYLGARAESTTLDEAQVVEALGVSQTSHATGFLARVLARDVRGLLSLIDEIYRAGIDLKHFSERVLEELRLLYLLVVARAEKQEVDAEELDISGAHYHELVELARQASLVQLERIAQILSRTISQLGWSSLPRFLLEMTAVRLTKLDGLARIEASLAGGTAPPAAVIKPATQKKAPEPETRPTPSSAGPTTLPEESLPPPGNVAGQWKAFVETVMKKRPLLGALLAHANFRMESSERGKTVVLAFAPSSFYERQAHDTKSRAEIEENLKSFFGRDTQLTLSSDLTNTTKSLEQVKQEEATGIKQAALEHPAVLKMKETLGAEVVDVNVDV